MRRIYQTAWQGIQFSDFSEQSSTSLAGPAFYQAFYKEFFARYNSWEDLAPEWRREKERCADIILSRSRAGASILSVGCGLGYMEQYMRARVPEHDLFVHDVVSTAWRWIEKEFRDDRKFLGMIPDCLPKGRRFDLVYLCAVDYALDDGALVRLLADIRDHLGVAGKGGGQCLLISASLQETPVTVTGMATSVARVLKALAAAAVDRIGLRSRGQFWGWMRTQEEYRFLMRQAGYCDIESGFVDPAKRAHYWIAGR